MELINLENVMQTLQDYAQEVRNLYQDNLIRSDRVASGKLLNSVEYQVVQNGQAYLVQLRLEDYWRYIEEGTRPHFPPMDKILEWIMVKPVLPRPNAEGDLPTPKQLAFLIARNISRHGTKGTHDLQSAIDDVNVMYRDKLVIALHKDMEVLMKVMVGTIQGSVPGA